MATDKEQTAITPTRTQDYPEWFQQVVKHADMADNSPVRGCMVIKPWGYGVWENIQRQLDDRIKSTGHQNAYFPLFIPLSYLEKEAETRRRVCQRVRCRHPPSPRRKEWQACPHRRTGRAPDRPPDVRDDHRRIVLTLDRIVPRPPLADQPVGQRGPLGDASAGIFAHDRIPLAGGAHGPRVGAGGH